MSDKAKQIIAFTIAALAGMSVFTFGREFLFNMFGVENPGMRILIAAICGAAGGAIWVLLNKGLAKAFNVPELGKND